MTRSSSLGLPSTTATPYCLQPRRLDLESSRGRFRLHPAHVPLCLPHRTHLHTGVLVPLCRLPFCGPWLAFFSCFSFFNHTTGLFSPCYWPQYDLCNHISLPHTPGGQRPSRRDCVSSLIFSARPAAPSSFGPSSPTGHRSATSRHTYYPRGTPPPSFTCQHPRPLALIVIRRLPPSAPLCIIVFFTPVKA